MSPLDVLGWAGSALLVYSVMQTRVLRFRVANLVACVVLTVFNALIGVWPMVGMNVALGAINAWFLRRLLLERHDDAAFEVLPVGLDDAYLRHVLGVHGDDVARFQPGFDLGAVLTPQVRRSAFLVLHGDETVGVVVLRRSGDGEAEIELDYVTPRYRDFSPGEFVWHRSGLLAQQGLTRVVSPAGLTAPYYPRVGFTERSGRWVLEV